MQCRSLRPLLADMQEAGLTYHWGFPFSLQVRKEGRQVTLHNKDDLPHFISTLELGNVDFPDWRGSLGLPTLALPQPWLPARGRGCSRCRKRQTSQGPSTPRDCCDLLLLFVVPHLSRCSVWSSLPWTCRGQKSLASGGLGAGPGDLSS